MTDSDEVSKLQHHLSLLRDQYTRCQLQLSDTTRRLAVMAAECGRSADLTGNPNDGTQGFVGCLVTAVSSAFHTHRFSDISVRLSDGSDYPGHRLVLAARGLINSTCNSSAAESHYNDIQQLDWSCFERKVALVVLKWVYTDQIILADAGAAADDDTFVLDVLKAASVLKLAPLRTTCEERLLASVSVKNCVRFYSTADEIGADTLKQYCSQLISSHWADLTSADFADMKAALMYDVIKSKSAYPLHSAIRLRREDVVFLFLLEFQSQLKERLNECCGGEAKTGGANTEDGIVPLDMALRSDQSAICETLLNHGADTNATDSRGRSLLHRAVDRGDEKSVMFLLQHGAQTDRQWSETGDTPLHLLARTPCQSSADCVHDWRGRVAAVLLATSDNNVNKRNHQRVSALQESIACGCWVVFDLLLQSGRCDLTLTDSHGHTVLWHALQTGAKLSRQNGGQDKMAERLVEAGANVDFALPSTKDSLLHLMAGGGLEDQALFLVQHNANTNVSNQRGETPLHLAASDDLWRLVEKLLLAGADPNAVTWGQSNIKTTSSPFDEDDETVSGLEAPYRQTPLHLSVRNGCSKSVETFLLHHGRVRQGDGTLTLPNLDIADSQGSTALSLSLQLNCYEMALKLVKAGASLDCVDNNGTTLLHRLIDEKSVDSALFLLNNGADANIRTQTGDSPLRLAIAGGLCSVVDRLCELQVDMTCDPGRDPLLWQALMVDEADVNTGSDKMAPILIKYGIDVDCWCDGPDGCQQTLLHRAIDENNERAACFLIRSGCDAVSPRRPSVDGGGGGDLSRDLMTPLHMCAQWCLEDTLQCLLERGVPVNERDCDMKTALHLAIESEQMLITSLLLSCPQADLTARDKFGQSPFTLAMLRRNNRAAQAILDREPGVAEQFDNRGRNFLHVAIERSDVESVMFLLSIHVNIHSCTRDSLGLTPLHLAAQANSEIILRNLLLAGACIDELTTLKQTALHLAAERDNYQCISVLLEKDIDFNAIDSNRDNALHVACREGHLASVRVLLSESDIDAKAVNLRGRSPLHCTAAVTRDSSAAICQLFVETIPKYPFNAQDADGNTALLLAYTRGAVQICMQLVKAGCSLRAINNEGISVFNFPVATKELLYRMLDSLPCEPAWSDGDCCMECSVKFGLSVRKHHCRHCGRLLCSKCSDKQTAIVKYSINKLVRVCDVCFKVLTQI